MGWFLFIFSGITGKIALQWATPVERVGPIEDIAKGVKAGNISDSCFKYSCHLLSTVGMDEATAWTEIQNWYARCETDNRSIKKIELTFKNAVRRIKLDGKNN